MKFMKIELQFVDRVNTIIAYQETVKYVNAL